MFGKGVPHRFWVAQALTSCRMLERCGLVAGDAYGLVGVDRANATALLRQVIGLRDKRLRPGKKFWIETYKNVLSPQPFGASRRP